MSSGFLRRQNNRSQKDTASFGAPIVRLSAKEASWEVEAVVAKITAGHFTHYAKGGFSRKDQSMVSAMQVAHRCGVPMNTCLLQIKDPRIEQAVMDAGLIVVSPSTHRIKQQSQGISVWRAGNAH